MRPVTPWWIRYPRRWQQELDALTHRGWQWTVDASDQAHGLVSLRVHHPDALHAAAPVHPHAAADPADQHDSAGQTPTDDPRDDPGNDPRNGPGAADDRIRADRRRRGSSPRQPADPPVPPVSSVSLTVVFPAAYPFFPPDVRDPQQTLPINRHRDPVHGRLCLIHAQHWDLTTTAAQLLADRLPLLLADAGSQDAELDGRILEDPTPEPVGLCVPRTSARILVDGSWAIPAEVDHGTMLVGLLTLEDLRIGPGVVKRVLAPGLDLDTLAETPGRLFGHNVLGRWTRYPDFRPNDTARTLWRRVEPRLDPIRVTIAPGPDPSPGTTPTASDGWHLDDRIQVIGLLVPSEMRYREPGEEWIFLIRTQSDPAATPTYQVFGSAPAGADDVAARTPATAPVRGRSALVVGVGALGGTIAVELARAGIGNLDLLDGDVIDPATSCRQIAPALYAGLPKAGALREVLAENNPHTHVRAHQVDVGSAQPTRPGEPDPHTILVDLIQDMDLVVDTAADTAVSRYLATICRATATTFLHASATAGGHGGVVAAFGPEIEACWWCLLHHRHHRTVPFPPAAAGDEACVAPAGCSEPTFAGTGADLTTVAVHAARVALDRLIRPPLGASTAGIRGDLYVARLRDHRGRPIPVRWHARTLTQHPDCPMHPDDPDHPGHRSSCTPPLDAPLSTNPAPQPTSGRPGTPPTDPAATAHPSPPVTVTPAAGHRTTPAPTRTLRTQQRTSTSTGADAGVVPDPNPARQEVNEPWPPATALTPATATSPPPSIS